MIRNVENTKFYLMVAWQECGLGKSTLEDSLFTTD